MTKEEHYHFIGIGGIGMSALASILLQRGTKVTGSDIFSSAITQQLQTQGAQIFTSHLASNVCNPSAVVYSSDIKEENAEIEEARRAGLPCLHRSEVLDHLMQQHLPLLVTGTHGKTTTSSLLAHLLVEAGLDPSYAVGGFVSSLNAHAKDGKGSYFVAEADESDGSFLTYTPFGAIITNIDNDHLDYWKSLDRIVAGFHTFITRVQSPEHLFWCGDDDLLRGLKPKGFSYGFDETNDVLIQNFCQNGWKTFFDLSFEGKHYGEVEIPLVGAHNVLNATAVFGLGLKVGIPEEKIRNAFSHFKGVSRRAEFKGEKEGISVFDDYGHHPAEIFATLRAIKQAIGHRPLVVAFQPHRYTRTRDCLHEFGPAFERADQLIVTDIYSAREMPVEGVDTQLLLKRMKETVSLDVRYVPRNELTSFLVQHLQKEDVLVTMGAGDITQVGSEVLQRLP